MNKSSILAATIACSRAITMQAQADTKWDPIGDLESLGKGALKLGEDIINTTENVVVGTGEALINPDTYIDFGNFVVDLTVDTAEWLVDP